ncbi:hypothetical protein EV2_012300 [Malus domestica]
MQANMKGTAVIIILLLLSFFNFMHAKEVDESRTGKQAGSAITFSDEDLIRPIEVPHNDELVVQMLVATTRVDKILIDTGASVNIIFLSVLKRMGLSERDIVQCRRADNIVAAFGENARPMGIITLPVTAGIAPKSSTVMVDFSVLDDSLGLGYNIIFGIPGLNALRAVPSTYHLLLRFPTEAGIGQVRGDQLQAREYYKPRRQLEQVRRRKTQKDARACVILLGLIILLSILLRF